jgi:hypothetical protein
METDFMSAADHDHLRKVTLTINTFFGWEFNSCEALRKDGVWYPIDFANPCPDSQVTSLHWHFPWLVKAYLRWSIFCAATKRPMRLNQHWHPYLEIADLDLPWQENQTRRTSHADWSFRDLGAISSTRATNTTTQSSCQHNTLFCYDLGD